MANPPEAPVGLQADSIAPVPNGDIRTIAPSPSPGSAGVPVPMRQQVVCLADAAGNIFDPTLLATSEDVRNLIAEMRELRRAIHLQQGIPFFPVTSSSEGTGGTT